MVEKRSIAVAIILTVITCGIYGIYWFICLTNEANILANRKEETSGGVAFVLNLITCGIYGLYWAYKMGEKIDAAKAERGISNSSSMGIVYLILCFFGLGIVAYALMQDEINKLA